MYNSNVIPTNIQSYVENEDMSFIAGMGQWIGLNRGGKAVPADSPEAKTYAFTVFGRAYHAIGSTDIAGYNVVTKLGAVLEITQDIILDDFSTINVGDLLYVDTFDGVSTTNPVGDAVLTVLAITDDILTGRIDNLTVSGGGSNDSTVVIDPALDENNDGIVDKYELREAVLDIDEDHDTDIHDLVDIINNQALN